MVRNYYEKLYVNKFENLGGMDTFLEKYNLPKLNEEKAEILNTAITPNEIEAVIKKPGKNLGPHSFTPNTKPQTQNSLKRIPQST